MCVFSLVHGCVRACVCVCGFADAVACACVPVVTQHAKRMRRIVLSSVASLAPPHFLTLSRIKSDFKKDVIEHKMCVWIFSTTFIRKSLILRRIKRDIVINVKTSLCEVLVIRGRF